MQRRGTDAKAQPGERADRATAGGRGPEPGRPAGRVDRLDARIAALPLWARLALAAPAGAATALAQPPVSIPWVLFAAVPAIAWLLWRAPTGLAAAATGWAAGFGAFVAGLHWMGHAFLVDPDRFAWLMPLAVAGLPAGLALFWAAAGWLAHRLGAATPLGAALATALALTTAELARATVLTGFPWGLPGYAWVETPAMQAARLLGPHGMTLATLLLTALVLPALWRPRLALLPLAALALAWGDGTLRLDRLPEAGRDAPTVRIVQQNVPQHLKWRPEHAERFAERLGTLSAAPPDPRLGPPDVVVWPETAVTFLPQNDPAAVRAAAASTQGAPLVTGALFYTQVEGRRRWTNSLMVATAADGVIRRYDKHHLVPFGEYLPLHGLLSALGLDAIAGMGGGGLVPGPGPRILDVPGLPPFAPAICYEMIFAAQVVAPGPRPGWILHVTNDAWFGRFAGPQQHLAQARIRAIEQGLPVVRAAQTGISAVIDAGGRVRVAIPLGRHGHADAALPPALAPTPYARLGDTPALALIVLGWIGLIALRRKGRA